MKRRKRAAKELHPTQAWYMNYHFWLWLSGIVVIIWAFASRSSNNSESTQPQNPNDTKVAPDLPIAGPGGKALNAADPNDEKRALLHRAFEDYARKLKPSRIAALVNGKPAANGEKVIQKDGSKIRHLLPATGRGSPKEDFFGVVEEDVDPVKYLYLHLSLNGADSYITMYERRRSSFFEAVEGFDFAGLMTLPNDTTQGLKGSTIASTGFDSTQSDYFNSFIYNQDGATYTPYDPVYVDPASVGFWRYDQWQQSVLLEVEACPWSRAFHFQRIQFYFFQARQQIGANIYCKADPDDPSWSYIGYTVMKMTDDKFDPQSDDY